MSVGLSLFTCIFSDWTEYGFSSSYPGSAFPLFFFDLQLHLFHSWSSPTVDYRISEGMENTVSIVYMLLKIHYLKADVIQSGVSCTSEQSCRVVKGLRF